MKKHNWNEEMVEEFLMKLYIALRKYKFIKQAFKPTWKERILKVITKCAEIALGKAVGELAGRGISLLIEKIGSLLES